MGVLEAVEADVSGHCKRYRGKVREDSREITPATLRNCWRAIEGQGPSLHCEL